MSDATDLTPRDALVEMLRLIDADEISPAAMVICFTQGGATTGFISSAPDVVTQLGLLEATKLLVHDTAKGQ